MSARISSWAKMLNSTMKSMLTFFATRSLASRMPKMPTTRTASSKTADFMISYIQMRHSLQLGHIKKVEYSRIYKIEI